MMIKKILMELALRRILIISKTNCSYVLSEKNKSSRECKLCECGDLVFIFSLLYSRSLGSNRY